MRILFIFILFALAVRLPAEVRKDTAMTTISFAAGAWDPARWTAARLANQGAPKAFTQLDGAIGTTMETFTPADYNAETDNALLLYDLGATEAEIAVTVEIGKGFNGYACPGLCLAPVVKDGVVVSSLAVFAADYTLAVWYQTTAADGKTVLYRHLTQLGRWSDPTKPHILRARISKKEASVAVQLDDADPVVFTYLGNATYGSVAQEVNPVIGLWGCHGACAFREMTITTPGTLPFIVRTPAQ